MFLCYRVSHFKNTSVVRSFKLPFLLFFDQFVTLDYHWSVWSWALFLPPSLRVCSLQHAWALTRAFDVCCMKKDARTFAFCVSISALANCILSEFVSIIWIILLCSNILIWIVSFSYRSYSFQCSYLLRFNVLIIICFLFTFFFLYVTLWVKKKPFLLFHRHNSVLLQGTAVHI